MGDYQSKPVPAKAWKIDETNYKDVAKKVDATKITIVYDFTPQAPVPLQFEIETAMYAPVELVPGDYLVKSMGGGLIRMSEVQFLDEFETAEI